MHELNEHINWQELFKVYENQSVVDAKIIEIVNNGYKIDVLGLESYIPLLNKALGCDNPKDLIGKTLPVCITKFKPLTREIIVSYDKARRSTQLEQMKEAIERIQIGSVVDGVIKNITSYGLFVTIAPGVDGLVHIKELSHTRIDIASTYHIGEHIKVRVIGIDGRKVSLSHLYLDGNPWNSLPIDLKPGAIVDGIVDEVQPYGAFISVGEGVKGLLHVSEISWIPVSSATDCYSSGDKVKVKVLAVNRNEHKITLSVKQLTDDPWITIDTKYHIGDTVDCKILKVEKFGIRVSIDFSIEGIINVLLNKNSIERKSADGFVKAIITDIDHKNRIVKLQYNAASGFSSVLADNKSVKENTENKFSISELDKHIRDILGKGGSGIPKARKEVQHLLLNCSTSDFFWTLVNDLMDINWSIFRIPVANVFNTEGVNVTFKPSTEVMDDFVNKTFAYRDRSYQNIDLVYPFKDSLSQKAKEIVYNCTGELGNPSSYMKFLEILGNGLTWDVDELLHIGSSGSLYALYELLKKAKDEQRLEQDANKLIYYSISKLDNSKVSRMINDVIRAEFFDEPPTYLTSNELQKIIEGGYIAFSQIQSSKSNKKYNIKRHK